MNQKTLLSISVFLLAMAGTTFAQPSLFPFQVGLKYEYARSDNTGREWTVHRELKSQVTINSLDYFQLQDWNYSNDSASEDVGYVRSTEQGLYAYNPGGNDYLEFQKSPVGTKWSFYQPSYEFGYKVIEIVAIETVTVPYGTFDSAYKHRRYRCADPNDLTKGRSPDWYEWFVPGVGVVKEEDHWNDHPPAIMELVRVLVEPETQIVLQEYYPLEEGITWNYLQTYADGHKNFEAFCLGGTEEVNGGIANKMWEFDSGELVYYDYHYKCIAWTTEGLKQYKDVTSDGSYTIYDPPSIQLPRLIRIGETFEHTCTVTEFDDDGNVVGSWPYSIELMLEGREDVKVPAGRFAACLKFSGTIAEGGRIPEDLTVWLAPGIGDVKRILAGGFMDENRELVSFTGRGITYYPAE